jgi:hypothetical protein
MALLPLGVAADDVPASVVALLPSGAKLGKGSWAVLDTEFGKTFGADMQAASFPGQRPSCVYAGTPELGMSLKGDTAWENPPMLDMAVSIHEEGIRRAPAAMSEYTASYIKDAPDVVAVGAIQEVMRPNGYIALVEYKEDCTGHPSGSKTRIKGFARRGATQLEFHIVVALDSAAAVAMADEILARFDRLDIAALTQ